MKYIYKDLEINYEVHGNKAPIILLHGWGTNLNTFNNLTNFLKEDYTVYTIDLPGFGKSEEPKSPFKLDDYVNFLELYIKELQIEKPIILGHSFGGRIAIKYASKNQNISKLILVDSAGIKKSLTLNKKFQILKYKFLKMFYRKTKNVTKYNQLIKVSGSPDYANATNVMKGTMIRVIKEDLKKCIKQIKVETLIIWGKDDQETPLKDGIYMNKHIKNSGLVIFDNCGHFPYLEKKYYFHRVIGKYLGVCK